MVCVKRKNGVWKKKWPYINCCANMAESYNIGVPWIMCQQPNAPQPMINTCNGWYCHDFEPSNPNSAKMRTENWVGWFKIGVQEIPHRREVLKMLPMPWLVFSKLEAHSKTTTCIMVGLTLAELPVDDYDALLDEYGNIAQPKWDNLKSMQKTLTYGMLVSLDGLKRLAEKTTFQAPLGKDPVVVDLQGLGKGFARVNGHSLGRYWPRYIAPEDGCSDEPCDYRGEYRVTNCGQPSQRWYRVPRSFHQEGVNTEFGANPLV